MFWSIVSVSLVMLSSAAGLRAQSSATFSPEGGESLPLMAEARRAEFLDSLDVYTLAIYSQAAIREKARLASPDTAKLVRVTVSYDNGLQRRAQIDWARELTPRIEAPAAQELRARFVSLRKGDVVSVGYVPSKGTTIRINSAIVAEAAHHDVMLAFLDLWLGQRPVSEELKRALLSSPQ